MIYASIQKLIDYAIKNDLIEKVDELVIRNQLMDALHEYHRIVNDMTAAICAAKEVAR